MKSVSQIIKGPTSPYTGSEMTRDMVLSQIVERYGKKEAESYDPYMNTRTFTAWLKLGYRVKKGEKALRSVTFIEKKDEQGNVVERIKRTVFLFYYKQVELIKK